MAIATYTTDLTAQVAHDFETVPTMGEFTGFTAGRAPSEDTDYPIQGTQHASDTMNATGNASIAVDTGATITWTSGWAFFTWIVWTAPGAIDIQANGGLSFLVGDSTTSFNEYWVGGKDFGSYPYGGWQNFAVDPEVTPDVGTATTWRWFGPGVRVLSAVSKGSPLGVDYTTYGRGESRFAGGDLANGYANFEGFALLNDANTARWGLLQSIQGGYKYKGLMILGYLTATEFTDANKSIVIDNTEYVQPSFNRIELRNVSSIINWTNISFTALGIVSKGQLEMIDNCTFNDIGGVFTDMDTFIYQSNATLNGKTFRRCGLVTQGSATFTGCTFDEPSDTVGLLVNALGSVTKCTFNSDGTGHAVNLGTITADVSLNWDNFESGYATTNGATGNETILVNVNAGVTLTINVATGASTPTYYNTGTGTVNVVSGQVTTTITVKDINTSAVLQDARVYLVGVGGALDGVVIFNTLTDINGQVSDTRSFTANQPVIGRVRLSTSPNFYKTVPIKETISSSTGLTLNVSMIPDN